MTFRNYHQKTIFHGNFYFERTLRLYDKFKVTKLILPDLNSPSRAGFFCRTQTPKHGKERCICLFVLTVARHGINIRCMCPMCAHRHAAITTHSFPALSMTVSVRIFPSQQQHFSARCPLAPRSNRNVLAPISPPPVGSERNRREPGSLPS